MTIRLEKAAPDRVRTPLSDIQKNDAAVKVTAYVGVQIDDVPTDDGWRLITVTHPGGKLEFRGEVAATIRKGLDQFRSDPRAYDAFVAGIIRTGTLAAKTGADNISTTNNGVTP